MVHLGDYIYEYQNGYYGWGQSIGRVPLPDKEIFSLYDYRKRLATYRTDLDLLASHQHFPWIPVWDDHGKKLSRGPLPPSSPSQKQQTHFTFNLKN